VAGKKPLQLKEDTYYLDLEEDLLDIPETGGRSPESPAGKSRYLVAHSSSISKA
jgi:hypothetical protein